MKLFLFGAAESGNVTARLPGNGSAFCIEGSADESAVREAAVLGQQSGACHRSVSSALLDMYLPCGAAAVPPPCRSSPAEASLLLQPLFLRQFSHQKLKHVQLGSFKKKKTYFKVLEFWSSKSCSSFLYYPGESTAVITNWWPAGRIWND